MEQKNNATFNLKATRRRSQLDKNNCKLKDYIKVDYKGRVLLRI
jgi:hypothetical protein